MLKPIQIQSHKGVYAASFIENAFQELQKLVPEKTQLIVDQQVFNLYKTQFDQYLPNFHYTVIEATEENKNLNILSSYILELMKNGIRIDHTLVAIGGGVIQDITCFLATTLFRGMKWGFVPTTLLAQTDSCIGSKSSINVGDFKNLMGTFTPPTWILIDLHFLKTLKPEDIASGIGEILKVHMVKGIPEFEKALSSLKAMKQEPEALNHFIYQSLLFKKELIELDEFDKGPRNVMNYGHSFGHAIESATNFAIPHGIAVTIGMDMANHQSMKLKRISESEFIRWHQSLCSNFKEFPRIHIDLEKLMSAIRKDKKNTGSELSLILVRSQGPIEKIKVSGDNVFQQNCAEYLQKYYIGDRS